MVEMVSYSLTTRDISNPRIEVNLPDFSTIEAGLEKTTLEMIAKHHTDIKLYFHGTSDRWLQSILHNGLGVTRSIESYPNYEKELMSIGSIYLTRDLQYAHENAKFVSGRANFKKIIVVCEITSRDDIGIDEDTIRTILYNSPSFHKYRYKDCPDIRKDNEVLDEFEEHLRNILRQTKEKRIPALQSFNRFFDKNKKRIQEWLYLFHLSTLKGELDKKGRMKQYLTETKWLIFQLGKFVSAFNNQGNDNITFNAPIGFKGKNKIVAIYRSNWGKMKEATPEEWTVIYNNNSMNIDQLNKKFAEALSNKQVIFRKGRREGKSEYNYAELRKN
jgi:hypothetical protein